MGTLMRKLRLEVTSMSRRPPHRGKLVIREYQLQEREQKIMHLLDSFPNKIVRGLAMRSEAEWHYGRLYLVGAITKDQYDAANSLDRITRSYRMMIKRYGHVKAAKHEASSGSTTEDLSLSAQNKMEKVQKKYNEMYGVLKECGEEIEKAIIDALEKDEQTDLELIRDGLTVLAAFGRRLGRRKK